MMTCPWKMSGQPLAFRGTCIHVYIWGFPKIRGTLLRVPIIRTIVFWGLYWGPLILGNYHIYIYMQRHTHPHLKPQSLPYLKG